MLWPHRMHNPLVSQGRPRLGRPSSNRSPCRPWLSSSLASDMVPSTRRQTSASSVEKGAAAPW